MKILLLVLAIDVVVLTSILLQGCFSKTPEPLFIYKWAQLKAVDKVKIYADYPGYYLYWEVSGSGIKYEPLYAHDTTGMNLKIGMQTWVPLKR